ncbi:hypothetical protein DFR55_1048 [Herbinix hemicellulosilytica]|uniref:DUF3278 domain-containing protein n=1 Tax=Herbinix hemicellulosilytica TaxID=1564487 RepID=A0A0H5SK41_HERHM|nr:hypothetical protein [Herbinix hemicellulosilytica]RBP59753.1 hypothetical protein DFR55_1048 [Herbinix hemicellulosilytica]CRZ35141.1 hypothetical protein HHT355_1942 [Herbinix hemicellulosilytica]
MKKYHKDYRLVKKEQPDGTLKQETEYIGKYYICQLDESKLKKIKLYFFALVLCSDATAIGIGFINNPGSRVLYVALPYVGLFLPIVFCFMGTVRFIREGNILEQAAYDKTKKRIFSSTVWQIILSSMTFVGDVILIINENDNGILKYEWMFAVSMLLVLIINIVFLQLQKKVTYQVKDPDYNS